MSQVRPFTHRAAPVILLGAALLVLCWLTAAAQADVVYLKNGSSFEGRIVEENEEQVLLETDAGRLYLNRRDIERIEKKSFEQVEIRPAEPTQRPEPARAPAETAASQPGPTEPGTPTEAGEAPQLAFNELQDLELQRSDRWMRLLVPPGSSRPGTGEATTEDLKHRGYDHTVLEPLPRNAGYRITNEDVLLRYSLKLREFSVLEVAVDRKFQPVRYSVEFLSRRDHTRVEGERKGDKLVVTTTKEAGRQQTRELPYPTGYLVLEGCLRQFLASGDLKVGVKQQYKLFDLFASEPGVDQLEVLREETIPVQGRRTNTFVVSVKSHFADTPAAEILYWIAPPQGPRPGRIVRVGPPDASMRYELASEDEATVLVADVVRDLGVRGRLFGAVEKPEEEETEEAE